MKQLFFVILIISLYGCRSKDIPEHYIARVGDSYLTLDDVENYLNKSTDTSSLQYKLFLKRWIENEVLYLEAKEQDFDKSETIQRQLEEVKKQLTISEYLEQKVYSNKINVSDQEISQYYTDHLDEFILTEDVVKINVLTFDDRKIANEFRAEILKNENWSLTLEKFLSDDKLKNSIKSIISSQLYTQLTLFPIELWKIVQNLQQNEVSFPVKINDYIYIVQLTEHYKKGEQAPLIFVKEEIKNRLTIEKRKKLYSDMISSLLKKHDVEIKLNE